MTGRRALVVGAEAATEMAVLGFLRGRGYQCVAASSPDETQEALANGNFTFTLVDLSTNGADARQFRECLVGGGQNSGPVIAVSKSFEDTSSTAIEADAVLHKPLSLEELQQTIAKLVRPQAQALLPTPGQQGGQIWRQMELWCSPKMLEARQIIRETARVDVTVLVTGETGSGKELVARAIHNCSNRQAWPFVKVNCAAMPRELLESELFGYERGAFTGAHKLKIGKFEAAHRGTIFLDEIGDLHPALQAKLLHVLQDGEFSRIGAKSTLSVDVRILAATNQDLERAVAEGRFREDLYYRLNVVHVLVPPLRERTTEIPLLANYFVERYAKLYRRDGFSHSRVGDGTAHAAPLSRQRPRTGESDQTNDRPRRSLHDQNPASRRRPDRQSPGVLRGGSRPRRHDSGAVPQRDRAAGVAGRRTRGDRQDAGANGLEPCTGGASAADQLPSPPLQDQTGRTRRGPIVARSTI